MTINKNLLFIILPIFIFTLGCYFLFEITTTQKLYQDDFDNSIKNAITVLTPGLKNDLYNLDKFSTRITVKGLFSDINIKKVLVFKEDKEFYIGLQTNEKNELVNIDKPMKMSEIISDREVFKENEFFINELSGKHRRYIHPLLMNLTGNNKLFFNGILVVEASTEKLNTRIVFMIIRFLLGLSACVLTSVIFIYMFLQFKLIKPIVRLMQAMLDIAAGKNTELHASQDSKLDDINQNDRYTIIKKEPLEIRMLGNAFNQMIFKIVESKRTIDNINRNLERLVDEKTATLQETVDKLKEQQEAVIHLAKLTSLGEMAGGIAHEINNPLTVISGNIYVLNKMVKAGQLDWDAFNSSVTSIGNTVTRISKITYGLLAFSRKEGNQDYTAESAKDIIDQAVVLCSEKFRSHGIKLILDILDNPEFDSIENLENTDIFKKSYQDLLSSGNTNGYFLDLRFLYEDFTVECLSVQVAQVILNLLNNSFHAVQDLPEKWIVIKTIRLPGWVEFRITDSGSGIPSNIRDKIMQPFFTSKKVGEGTGLGLSLSLGIIKSHGGQLKINEMCSNTQFIIRLPLKQATREVS